MTVRRLLVAFLLGSFLAACQPAQALSPVPTEVAVLVFATETIPPVPVATAVATVTQVVSRPQPTAVSTVISLSPAPQSTPTVFQKMVAPFATLAKLRREQSEEYKKCADRILNEGRLNVLLFGYGETYEPRPEDPDPVPVIIGSLRYLSLDLGRNTVAVLSLTHDIRCPECELALAAKQNITRRQAGVLRLDHAYLSPAVGSFALLRKTLCDATGLWPDFQMAFHDTLLRDLVDGPWEGVQVEVPDNITVQPFYLGGRKYDRPELRSFPKGLQTFDGLKALAYIKTVPVPPAGHVTYPVSWEHQLRADGFFAALKKKAEGRVSTGAFWMKLSLAVTQHSLGHSLALDFDTFFLIRNLDAVAGEIKAGARGGTVTDPGLPCITLEKYIVDKSSSLDPKITAVRWVDQKVLDDYWMQDDFKNGVYSPNTIGLEVPYNANPYATDLIKDYWGSVRVTVREALRPDRKENGTITPD